MCTYASGSLSFSFFLLLDLFYLVASSLSSVWIVVVAAVAERTVHVCAFQHSTNRIMYVQVLVGFVFSLSISRPIAVVVVVALSLHFEIQEWEWRWRRRARTHTLASNVEWMQSMVRASTCSGLSVYEMDTAAHLSSRWCSGARTHHWPLHFQLVLYVWYFSTYALKVVLFFSLIPSSSSFSSFFWFCTIFVHALRAMLLAACRAIGYAMCIASQSYVRSFT